MSPLRLIKTNAPLITTSLAVIGVLGSVVLAIKATPKAVEEIQYTDDTKEIVKRCWRYYIPTGLVSIGTIGLIVAGHKIHTNRQVAMSAVSAITATAFAKYKQAVVENMGVSKHMEVMDTVARNRVEEVPYNEEVIIANDGATLCLDALSGRYFYSDRETMISHFNKVSRDLLSESFISVNDAMFDLGLKNTELGEHSGWHIDDGLIEPSFSSQLTENGIPCLVLDFETPPRYGV